MRSWSILRRTRGNTDAMKIRRAAPEECDALLELWLRSVRATHSFVTEEEILLLVPEVRGYLSSEDAEIWVLCDSRGATMGFMGLFASKVEALFLAPEFRRRGGGRLLLNHARGLHGALTVDVNEENAEARAFYKAYGFVEEGRSPLDGQGRPHPLLHLRLGV